MKNETKGCFAMIGIVLILIWAVINPISFLIIFVIGVVLFMFIRRKKEKNSMQKEAIMFNKWGALISNPNYFYIKNFANIYKNANYPRKELENLMHLLRKKNILLNEEEIQWIINKELAEQNYEYFLDKMHSCSLQNYEDYIRIFLEMFGESYESHLSFLERILNDEKIQYDANDLRLRLAEVKRSIEVEQFERKMRSTTEIDRISFEDLDLMTGSDFELFLRNLFEKMGYKVESTKLSHDQGADLIVNKFGDKISVQAKRHSNKVGNGAVQEVVASIKHYNADRGLIVTTNDFTRSAINLAESNNIELINRKGLVKLIEEYL